jgi:hypothetical protein
MTPSVGAGDLGPWLPMGTAAARLALVVGRARRATADADATSRRAGTSLAGAGADPLALARGQSTEDGAHAASIRGRGVGPGITQGGASGVLARDGGARVEPVAGAAGQPVKPGHQQHIPGGAPGEHLTQWHAVRLGTARDLMVDVDRPCGGQCRDWRLDALPSVETRA